MLLFDKAKTLMGKKLQFRLVEMAGHAINSDELNVMYNLLVCSHYDNKQSIWVFQSELHSQYMKRPKIQSCRCCISRVVCANDFHLLPYIQNVHDGGPG